MYVNLPLELKCRPRCGLGRRLYDVSVIGPFRLAAILLLLSRSLSAQTYTAPAGIRPAHRHTGASILPGGRIVAPLGEGHPTGPGAFGLAISPSGRFVVTANTGPGRNSLTILERRAKDGWDVRQVLPPAREDQEGKEKEV